MISIFNVALTSQNSHKIDAVEKVLNNLFSENDNSKYKLDAFKVTDENQVEQPVDNFGLVMARNRIKWLLNSDSQARQKYQLIISIENFLVKKTYEDYACVLMYDPRQDVEYIGYQWCGQTFDKELFDQLFIQYPHLQGATKSLGDLLHQKYKVPHDNWTGSAQQCNGVGNDRSLMIKEQLVVLSKKYYQDQECLQQVKNKFRYIKDFPIPGVNFKDWNDLFLDPILIKRFTRFLAQKYDLDPPIIKPNTVNLLTKDILPHPKIDYVIGLESRGFLIGMPLALELRCGFIPLRKEGKISHPKVTEAYSKEYGQDILELRSDLPKGRVLIVDDVLATGGSLKAAINLAEKAGHTIVDCIIVTDVSPLRSMAEEKLEGYPVRVILK